MKKSLFTTGLAFSMIFGISLSFSTQESMAQNTLTQADSEITCWSSGNVLPTHRYVNCSGCTSTFGQPTGGKGTCKS